MAATLGALAAAAACDAPAGGQAIVCVRVDEDSLARTEAIAVVVRSADGDTVLDRTARHRSADPDAVFPVRVPIAPRGGDASRTFEVEVELRGASGAFSRQTWRGGFREGGILVYEVGFEGACIGVLDCGPNETCTAGSCGDNEAVGRSRAGELSLDEICHPSILGSQQGYSGRAQGFEGWYYGYYDRASDEDDVYHPTEDFAFMVPVDGEWHVPGEPPDPWRARIWRDGVQPLVLEAEDGGPLWFVPIRRYVAPVGGNYRFEATVRAGDPRDPRVEPEADGVRALAWIEGELGDELFVEPDDGAPHRMVIETGIGRGDRVDFGLDSGPSAVFDPTFFHMDVTIVE